MTTQETPREQGRTSRIRRVVADFEGRVARGETVSEQSIADAHPELMPELLEELTRLRGGGDSRSDRSDSPQEPSVTATFDSVATRAHRHSHTVGSTATPAQPLSRIGHYEVSGLLGEGGFGYVYLAKDIDLERPVAIKVAKPGRSDSEAQPFSFLEEARRVALLNHPSIVKILDVSRDDGDAWYLVMEYVDGPSLHEVFREGSVDLKYLVELMAQVAEGVHHAHVHNILHRDLKPGNILIGKDGRPRIVDFGMALQVREQPFAPRQVSGTPYCMAPEQVRGETHRLDGRTDLWSLGIIFYQGLTGQRPFSDKSVERVFEAILGEEPPPPSQVVSGVPVELDRICLKCISKRMTDRYNSAAELALELRQWLADCDSRSSKGLSSAVLGSTATDDETARVVPKGLRSFGSEDAGFFLELLPGPRNRDGIPESVRFWSRAIENADSSPGLSVLVLYGPSGTGKSSFIKAGVLPHCTGSFSTVVVDAATTNLERDLLRSLRRVRPDLEAIDSLPRACAAIRAGGPQGAAGKVLIIIDQFEQWLYANVHAAAEDLTAAIRQCDGDHLQCLLIVRSDFWVGITRFMHSIEVPLVEGLNSAHLDLFDVRHARKVLTLFGQSYGTLPKPPAALSRDQQLFVEEAVEQITRDGWVTPVRLALMAEMLKAQEWTPATLRKLGGEQGIGVTYLDQVFSSPLAAPSHRKYRKAAEGLLRALLPDPGVELKGVGRSQHELRKASGLVGRPDRFAELIDILDSQLRLITPTESVTSLSTSGGGFESSANLSTTLPTFQLTHDYLVPALREWLCREQQATRQGRAQMLLEERDRLWRQNAQSRYLPTLAESARIAAFTRRSAWTTSQRSMMRRAAAHHLRSGLIGAAAVLGLAALLYATLPPDPLPVFLDPNQPTAARIEAFDRLDLSNVAEFGPTLAAMKREQDATVLERAVAGVEEFVHSPTMSSSGQDDSVKESILNVAGDLLSRETDSGGPRDEQLRARVFTLYTSLAPPDEALQFVADKFAGGLPIPDSALAEYFAELESREIFNATADGDGSIDSRTLVIVSRLVELIDVLPAGRARAAAVQLLAGLPVSRLADLLIQSYVEVPYSLSAQSAAILVRNLPKSSQAAEAQRLLAELTERLQHYVAVSNPARSPDELVYVLDNIAGLKDYAGDESAVVLSSLKELLDRRTEFQEGGVVDAACETFAAYYDDPAQPAPLRQASFNVLRETLADTAIDVDARGAAARSIGEIGASDSVHDLATAALDPHAAVRLRLAAIDGLAAMSLSPRTDRESLAEVAGVFAQLLDVDQHESEDLLPRVIEAYSKFAPLDEFPKFAALLRIKDDNLVAERAVWEYLVRFPSAAQTIVEQTLVVAAHLTEEQEKSLLPGPGGMLSDFQGWEFFDPNDYFASCRAVAPALAETTARHADPAVRRLAGMNLSQLQLSLPLPIIDADASQEERLKQLDAWRNAWQRVVDDLAINGDGQLEVHSAETAEPL